MDDTGLRFVLGNISIFLFWGFATLVGRLGNETLAMIILCCIVAPLNFISLYYIWKGSKKQDD